jgi:hypothetical protein
MNIPGLEENAIMIDSVSKDTTCGPELGVLFLRIKNYGNCDEICANAFDPLHLHKLAEAALDTTELF